MTISNLPARVIFALAVTVGLVLPTGFGSARAVESPDANRGTGDQTQTQTASRAGLRVGRPKAKTLTGTATFYGDGFHGRRTYTGERFNMYAMTLACRRLPMGTRVRVTNLRNGKSVIGRVNDYGPNGRFKYRVADLSKGMARKIGFYDGFAKVRLEVVH